jgi:hypothetical protein
METKLQSLSAKRCYLGEYGPYKICALWDNGREHSVQIKSLKPKDVIQSLMQLIEIILKELNDKKLT